MKKIEIIISKILIKLTYYLTYYLPLKDNRVSIISYFNNELGLEFSELVTLLEKDNVEVKKNLHRFNASLSGKFKYLFNFIYQTYLFNTSRIVILDGNNYVYSIIKTKKKVHTIQLWHSTGAIKKFGMDTDRRYPIKGYDSLIVSSEYFRGIFSKSLNTRIENVYAYGVCKTDFLFDLDYLKKQSALFYQKYPDFKDKRIVLYAPTFRGEGIEDMEFTNHDIDKLVDMLPNNYQVVVKLHPLLRVRSKTQAMDLSDEDLYMLLEVAEFVISDYSALVFDAVILKKKIILYLYDFDEYNMDRGLCIDLNGINLCKSYTLTQTYSKIVEYPENVSYKNVIYKYLSAIDGSSVRKIYNHINKIKEEGL